MCAVRVIILSLIDTILAPYQSINPYAAFLAEPPPANSIAGCCVLQECSFVLARMSFALMPCIHFSRLTGMPKEKYDPPDPRRLYTIMSAEEAANGKKSHWAELEISGQ